MRFSLRPVFIGWITLLAQLPLQLFFTIWGGGFFGGMAKSFGLFPGSGSPFIFFGSVAFVGVPLVAYFGKKLNYSRTEYKFFDDHVEFDEGFFTVNRKVVLVRDIGEPDAAYERIRKLVDAGGARDDHLSDDTGVDDLALWNPHPISHQLLRLLKAEAAVHRL
jgi:hypothetical protein